MTVLPGREAMMLLHILNNAIYLSQLPLLCDIQMFDDWTSAIPNGLVNSFSLTVASHDVSIRLSRSEPTMRLGLLKEHLPLS